MRAAPGRALYARVDGVRRGDRLVVWMTNTVEWVVATFGAMRIGAAVVPVNTFLKASEIKYFIEQSGARHLVMVDGFRKLSMPDILAEICPAVSGASEPGDQRRHGAHEVAEDVQQRAPRVDAAGATGQHPGHDQIDAEAYRGDLEQARERVCPDHARLAEQLVDRDVDTNFSCE